MTDTYANYRGTDCTYPGEYIPAPLMMEDLLNELKHPHEGASAPLINVAELKDAFIIEVAAPGLKSGDFYVSINDNVLTITVLHKETEMGIKKYHQHEFNYCCFKREIALPGNVDADFLSAVYESGVLCVRLPKSEAPVMNHVERILIYENRNL